LQDAWISAPRPFVSCAAAEARSSRCLPPLPHRSPASPASVRQHSLSDRGTAQAADVRRCTVYRDLAIRSQLRSGRCNAVRTSLGCSLLRSSTRCRRRSPPSSSFQSKQGHEYRSPRPRPWSARWTAGAELIAELADDMALGSALDRLPERLHRAQTLDWSVKSDDLAAPPWIAVCGQISF
jgi:hypothetical protein